AGDGVLIGVSAAGNTVGAGNVISANGGHGIEIDSFGKGNLVQGNLIGTDATGTAALGNARDGVLVNGASNNTVGDSNLIGGNGANGVEIFASDGNVVLGNFIGTNSLGTHLGNALDGV